MGDVVIAIPVSRSNFLPQLFESLDRLECDREKTSLLVYVDGDMRVLEAVKRELVTVRFLRKEYHFRNKGMGSVGSVRGRRQRIADIHNELCHLLPDTEYVFLIEDDTLVPADALKKLLENYSKFPHASFMSGIELGRWGFPIIGGWLKNGDNRIISVPMQSGIHSADAAGFYCMLTKTALYKRHFFKPYDRILGPDVDFGFNQSVSGCIDYSIQCVHLTLKEPLTFDKVTPIQLLFTRDNSAAFGWRQEVI